MIGSQRKRYRAAVDEASSGVNPNTAVTDNQSKLDKLAIVVTGNVGTPKFAVAIICWTAVWVGYNSVAKIFGLPMFDTMPALVAYLLISNVIQICLMPLIMVAQNMQSRQQEAKAEQDYRNNEEAVRLLRIMCKNITSE
jgi:uncharacterized membrane protein